MLGSIRHRPWLWVAALVCLGGVLFGAAIAWRVAQWERDGAARVGRALASPFGLRAEVGGVELSWPELELVARDLRLLRPSGERLLSVRRLHARLSWAVLLGGELDLRALSVSGAELRLRAGDPILRGGARLPQSLRTVAFSDSRLLLALPHGNGLELEAVRGGLRALAQGVSVYVQAERGALSHAQVSHPLARFEVRGVLSDTGFRLGGGSVQAAGARLSFRAGSGSGVTIAGELARAPFATIALSASASASSGALQLSALRLARGKTVLAGQAELRSDGTLDATLSGDRVDLADLIEPSAAVVGGTGQVTVRARGSTYAPDWDLELALHRASLDGFDLGAVTAKLYVKEDGGRVEVERADAGPVSTRGLLLRFDRGLREVAGTLSAKALPVERLHGWLAIGDDPVLGRLRGTATGTVGLELRRPGPTAGGGVSAGSLRLRLELQLARPELAGYAFDSGELIAQLESEPSRSSAALAIERLKLRAGEGTLSLQGERAKNGELALRSSFDRLPLGRVPFLRARAPSLEGRAKGGLRITGTPAQPVLEGELAVESVRVAGELVASLRLEARLQGIEPTGVIRVQELELGHGELGVSSPAPFEVRVAAGRVALADVPLQGPKLALALGADGSLAGGVRVFVNGTAPAKLLAPAGSGLTVYGSVALHAALDPKQQPWLRGEIEPKDVVVQLQGGALVKQIRGKLVLAGDRVSLRDVAAAFGGGEVRVGGELELEGSAIARHELTVSARGVTVEPQPRVELLLDADTKLTSGQGDAPPRLSGLLRVQRLVYGRHVQLPEALTALNREQRGESYDPARDRLAIDLTIEATAPIVVRNSLVDLELVAAGKEPRLRIVGSDQRLGVLGRLTVKRGRVLFRGDEFQVTRGEVQFENPKRIDPKFDVRALATRRKRPDANIVFLARGDRDAFEIDVSCDAPAAERAPPPFSCDYKNDTLRCDSFEELVTLWVCKG